MMYDENETAQLSGSSKREIEYRSSADGLKMSATPEASRGFDADQPIWAMFWPWMKCYRKCLIAFDIFPSADRGFVVMTTEAGEIVPRWVHAALTMRRNVENQSYDYP